MDTIEYAMFGYGTVEVENWLYLKMPYLNTKRLYLLIVDEYNI